MKWVDLGPQRKMELLTTRAVRKAGGQATPLQKEKDGRGLQRLAPRTLGQAPPAMRHSSVRLRAAEHSLAALGWEPPPDHQEGHAWCLWKGGGYLGKGSSTSRLSFSARPLRLASLPGFGRDPSQGALSRPCPLCSLQTQPPCFWSGAGLA